MLPLKAEGDPDFSGHRAHCDGAIKLIVGGVVRALRQAQIAIDQLIAGKSASRLRLIGSVLRGIDGEVEAEAAFERNKGA